MTFTLKHSAPKGMNSDSEEGLLMLAFRHLVEEVLGLHFSKEQEIELINGLTRTQRALNLKNLPTLFQRLKDEGYKGKVWRQLVLELTTGESFFFRDRGQMSFIRDVLLTEMKSRSYPDKPLRLWSAGCSQGEEAYSLAILIQETLPEFMGHQVWVLGTDINTRALETAREGWYSPWSLREMDPGTRERWFRSEGGGFRVIPELRKRVSFKEHNLCRDAMGELSEGQGFDLILCRNVFIYFQPRRVKEVIQSLRRSLKPAGVLVLGHGEWGANPPEGMSLEMHPHSAVLRPKEPLPPMAPPPTTPGIQPRLKPRETSLGHSQPKLPSQPRTHEERLKDFRALADVGHWDAALALSRKVLQDDPLSAPVHHLLALIQAERGNTEASLAMLDKALYLDPHLMAAHLDRARHFESLAAFDKASRAWAAALNALESLPEDVSLDDLEVFDRERLKTFLKEAMHRCEGKFGVKRT